MDQKNMRKSLAEDWIEDFDALPDEYLDEELNIAPGETLRITDRKIHLRTSVYSAGNIEFMNCVIIYNEHEEERKILVEGEGTVCIVDSVVICKGSRKDSRELLQQYLITCHSADYLSFKNTVFLDCAAFLASYHCLDFRMDHCKMINCYDRFMSVSGMDPGTSVHFSGCFFIQNDLASFHMETGDPSAIRVTIIEIKDSGTEKIEAVGCSFTEEESFRIAGSPNARRRAAFIGSNYGTSYENCSFTGLSVGIEAKSVKDCHFVSCTEAVAVPILCRDLAQTITDCRFEKCTNIFNPDANLKSLQVENCEFLSCYNRILSTGYQGGMTMDGCTFYDTFVQKDGDSWPSVFEVERDGSSSARSSIISRCHFIGVNLGKGYLFRANGFRKKPKGYAVSVSRCELSNCITDRPDAEIMDPYIIYDSVLKKNRKFTAIKIQPDCTGFDSSCA